MQQREVPKVARWILDAVKQSGARAIVSESLLGDAVADSNVFAIGASPHGKLFPRCAGVVHHGGAGTTATAARAGVPQVLVPHMTDQFFWRARLEERGITATPRVRRFNVDSLEAAIRACVADQGLRLRCRDFAAKMIPDGTARAIRYFEEEVAATAEEGVAAGRPGS